MWGVDCRPVSRRFRSLCEQRFGSSNALHALLKNLPDKDVELKRDGRHRCWLWGEESIAQTLIERKTGCYFPLGAVGDGSRLAIDFSEAGQHPSVGIFLFDETEGDEWNDFSESKFRRLSSSYFQYLIDIYNDESIGVITGTGKPVFGRF